MTIMQQNLKWEKNEKNKIFNSDGNFNDWIS